MTTKTGKKSKALATSELQSAMDAAARYRKERRSYFRMFLIVITIIAIVYMFQGFLPYGPAQSIMLAASILASLSLVVLFTMMPVTTAIKPLIETEDNGAVSGLIDVNEMFDPRFAPKAKVSLIRLLPQMTPLQGMVLNAYHRSCLRRYILPPPFKFTIMMGATQYRHGPASRELTFAVLEAMPNIANRDDLEFLTKIAAGSPRGGPDAEVLEKVREILPLVEAHMDSAKQRESLLRASTAPENLLRPAVGPTDESSELLLRPVISEE
ncbi:MAG: hypothetical protein ABJA67_06855 [Chthonomonadales bacterium]